MIRLTLLFKSGALFLNGALNIFKACWIVTSYTEATAVATGDVQKSTSEHIIGLIAEKLFVSATSISNKI